jgi:hypothetical protein
MMVGKSVGRRIDLRTPIRPSLGDANSVHYQGNAGKSPGSSPKQIRMKQKSLEQMRPFAAKD